MAADPIIYCLEQLTDYSEFEKLCCAILASETCYPQIDPMGGTRDGGRDAIVRKDHSGATIVFAFTVRKDWRDKLKFDSKRLKETRNKLDKLVFVCTCQLNANEKDDAVRYIHDTYGWQLDLFDQARLRALLLQPGSTLIVDHPSIFIPRFFPQPASSQRSFSQLYLDLHANLFQEVASSTEHLAVEIEIEMYTWIGWVVRNAKAVELKCYDMATFNALVPLHNALARIYGVISDEYYIRPQPNSWRMKFDNRERSDINVQKVLAAKKVEIRPYLEEFRVALENFSEISKDCSGLI